MKADERSIDLITSLVIEELKKAGAKISNSCDVPVGVSNRHIHLCQKDLDTLFGHGYKLTKIKDLSQPGEYACDETVDIYVNDKSIQRVRILGPVRKQTQVEVSSSDARKLRANPPVRGSGKLDGSSPVTIFGPKGNVELAQGLIVANRHIHLTPADAERTGLKDNQVVSVKFGGDKGGVLNNVRCRVSPNYFFEMHIDTDDASALGVNTGDTAQIIKDKE